MDKDFGGVIWTNHALERMRKRGIKQGDAWATFRRPDQSKNAKIKGAWVYYKTYPSTSSGQAQKIEVVAKKNEWGKWVILSVWSREVGRKPRLTGSTPVYGKKIKKVEPLWKLIRKRIFGKKPKSR